jgi:hypothetical protein
MRPQSWVAWLGLALLAAAPSAAATVQRLAIVQDIVHDADAPPGRRDAFLDTGVHIVWPRQHLTVMLGSFATGLEWGGFLRDSRGSAYGLALRRRTGGFVADTAFDLDTQQRWRNWVFGAQSRFFWPDHPEASNLLVVPTASAQFYYRDASYASLSVTRDPRPGTGTTFRFADRLAVGDVTVDTAIAPRTDGVVHWAVGVGWRHFLVGYGRERDFDFTRLDRRVFSFGFRWDFPVD